MIIAIDRSSTIPLYRQLITRLKGMFDQGTVLPGFRMPSTRKFAEDHGLSRSTVIKVYEELWALGYLSSRPGSYSVVRKKHPVTVDTAGPGNGLIDWEGIASEPSRILHDSNQGFWSLSRQSPPDDVIKFSSLALDLSLFPSELFRKCMNRVLRDRMPDIYNFSDPQGYPPLREFLSARMKIHGIDTSASEILITNGSQSSMNLILSLLSEMGRTAFIEEPTYFLLPPLLASKGLHRIGIALESDGMNINILRERFKAHQPAFLYTIPNAQNPTGITTSHAKREEILTLCEQYRCPIIEDAFEEEMKYFGKVPLPIKAMDRQQVVVYISSFSKVFFPGIRLGWIVAERSCIERLLSLKVFSDISSNLPVQAALAEFGHQGLYDLHIKRIHRVFRKRMGLAQKMMREMLNFNGVSWHVPTGGFIIWITMRDTKRTDAEIFELFLKSGVRVFPGRHSFLGESRNGNSESERRSDKHVRISISSLGEDALVEWYGKNLCKGR